MKSIFFAILTVWCVFCLSCESQNVGKLDARFRGIDDYLGGFIEIKLMNDELRNKYSYIYLTYKKLDISAEKIQGKLADFKLVNLEKDSDIPFLWLNSSTWELFTKKSASLDRVRRRILNGQRKNMYCFFRKDEIANERVIVFNQSDRFIVVLIETLKIN